MLKKQEIKNKALCKVTFVFPNGHQAKKVQLVGDFNHWDPKATPLKHLATGEFKTTLELPKGQSYQFRYLDNQGEWFNDDAADAYVSNPFGGDNSVVST